MLNPPNQQEWQEVLENYWENFGFHREFSISWLAFGLIRPHSSLICLVSTGLKKITIYFSCGDNLCFRASYLLIPQDTPDLLR